MDKYYVIVICEIFAICALSMTEFITCIAFWAEKEQVLNSDGGFFCMIYASDD